MVLCGALAEGAGRGMLIIGVHAKHCSEQSPSPFGRNGYLCGNESNHRSEKFPLPLGES